MNLGPLIAVRAACSDRPGWPALFAKAFALVARDLPGLRRAYCKFPWTHLYEYPVSVAAVAIEREYEGEPVVFFLQIKDPVALPVTEITRLLRAAQMVPVNKVKSFRRALRVARLVRPLRRLIWWLGLNIGRQRANYFGTFGVSVYSALGPNRCTRSAPFRSP